MGRCVSGMEGDSGRRQEAWGAQGGAGRQRSWSLESEDPAGGTGARRVLEALAEQPRLLAGSGVGATGEVRLGGP